MQCLRSFALCALLVLPLQAQAIGIEHFDHPAPGTGRVLFDVNPLYDGITDAEAAGVTGGDFNGNSLQNGQIVTIDPFNAILTDQSGTGFFLFSNTGAAAYVGGEEVWGTSAPVAVTPNTLYLFSFYLTNQNTVNNAQIMPVINGSAVGSSVSALGTFATNGWQQFTFLWDSGAATTADLSLVNQRSVAGGNDFGIDTIDLTAAAVPEPSTLALSGGGVLLLSAITWWRRRHA